MLKVINRKESTRIDYYQPLKRNRLQIIEGGEGALISPPILSPTLNF